MSKAFDFKKLFQTSLTVNFRNFHTVLHYKYTNIKKIYLEKRKKHLCNTFYKNNSTCGKTRNPISPKKFREINSLVISLVKTLFTRNLWLKNVMVNIRNFHSVKILLWVFDKNSVKSTPFLINCTSIRFHGIRVKFWLFYVVHINNFT